MDKSLVLSARIRTMLMKKLTVALIRSFLKDSFCSAIILFICFLAMFFSEQSWLTLQSCRNSGITVRTVKPVP